MTFQASDWKGKHFLELLNDDNNIIKLFYIKDRSWLKHFVYSNLLCVRAIMSSSQIVDLVSFYFIFHFHFLFILFSYFLFLEHRVRVRSQDTENKVEGSRTNDVIQHGHHMLAS